jgi:hypothetical protein
MNVAIFWDIAPCNPYVNRRFVETYHLHVQGWISAEQEISMQQVERHLLVHIRTTWRYIPDDGNIHNYRCENLRSYKGIRRANTMMPGILRAI